MGRAIESARRTASGIQGARGRSDNNTGVLAVHNLGIASGNSCRSRDLRIRNPSTSIEAYEAGLKTSPPGSRDAERALSMRIALLIVAAMLAAIPALAHSWYPLACCGNMDCFPVACDQLVETVSGWLYVPTGNLFTREQVQPSQDHHCHVCVGHDRDHRSICAFVVPNV